MEKAPELLAKKPVIGYVDLLAVKYAKSLNSNSMRINFFTALLKHQLKEFNRNERWQHNVIGKIIVSIFLLIILAGFLALGLQIEPVLKKFKGNAISNFNSATLAARLSPSNAFMSPNGYYVRFSVMLIRVIF